jgi:hypothetical protein
MLILKRTAYPIRLAFSSAIAQRGSAAERLNPIWLYERGLRCENVKAHGTFPMYRDSEAKSAIYISQRSLRCEVDEERSSIKWYEATDVRVIHFFHPLDVLVLFHIDLR